MNALEPRIGEPNIRPDCTDELTAALRQRIMVIDGAMGTAIQRDRPDEAGYRGERFTEWPTALQGNNDLLTLTQPQIIEGIHREYLEAGADILETNTFNANAVSLSDYDMAEHSYELNYAGAALARKACDEFSRSSCWTPFIDAIVSNGTPAVSGICLEMGSALPNGAVGTFMTPRALFDIRMKSRLFFL